MKTYPEFIQSFTARFRDDVYLENIPSGTIATGGNLGLDANNKIVKADTESGDLSITNASNNRIVTSTGGTGLNAESSITHTNFETQFNNSVGDYFNIAIGDAGATTLSTNDDASTGDGTSADLLVDVDGDITLDSHTGVHYIKNNGTTFVTFQNDVVRFDSSGVGLPDIQLVNSNTDANAPGLNFVKSATGADGDSLGRIQFVGDNENDVQHSYALIEGSIQDATDGQESGLLELKVADHDNTMVTGVKLDGDPVDGGVNVTIGGNASSTTNILGGISMGSVDGADSEIKKLLHDDGVGGNLILKAGGVQGGVGNNNLTGGNIELHGGGATGAENGGHIEFYSSTRGSGGDAANAVNKIASIEPATNLSNFILYEAGGASTDDFFKIACGAHGATTISTKDNASNAANFELDIDGDITFDAGGGNFDFDFAGTNIAELDSGSFELKGKTTQPAKIHLYEDLDNGTNKVSVAAPISVASDREIKLPDADGTVQLQGISAGKQFQAFACNFTDDIGTTKHYIPFKDINEQTFPYQEEVSMIAPCDGRVVSVTLTSSWNSTDSISGSGNFTVGVETKSLGNSALVSPWNIEETESLAFTSSDDNHAWHFAFSNDKHFESTEKFSISLQADSDPVSSSRFWIVTVVIEWDWTTFLGATSAEFETTP